MHLAAWASQPLWGTRLQNCSVGSMRLSILRCGSRWWQVWEDTESAAGNLRRDQHAPPHDGAAPCGFCLTRHRGTIHHAWRGEVASGAPPRRGQLTVALGVRFDSTKGSRIRRGALDWHPIHLSIRDMYSFYRTHERSAREDGTANQRTPRGYDAHYDALTIPSPGVALVHIEHSARNGRRGLRRRSEGIAAARHLTCATQAPAHATGWMSAFTPLLHPYTPPAG